MRTSSIHYLILDDEPIAQRILKDYADRLPYLVCMGQCRNPVQAFQILREQPVDLIFLDLHMPEIMGFDFLKSLHAPPQIIVTTAYEDQAVEGFALNVVDYLLKPISEARFLQAIQKLALPSNPDAGTAIPSGLPEKLVIKGDKTHHFVTRSEITHVEACGNYCLVHIDRQTILTSKKISDLEAEWQPYGFLRIHKSYLVAKSKIEAITAKSVKIHGAELPIGMAFKRNLLRELGLE